MTSRSRGTGTFTSKKKQSQLGKVRRKRSSRKDSSTDPIIQFEDEEDDETNVEEEDSLWEEEEEEGEGAGDEEEERGGVGGGGGGKRKKKDAQVGRPQVWVKIRPPNKEDDNVFKVDEDKKRLVLRMPSRESLYPNEASTPVKFTFDSDGVIEDASQEEVFQKTAEQVVNQAMEGTSGCIVCVGPQFSGKSFSLFGPNTKYQLRGIVPRSLEKIFEILEAKSEQVQYHVILSMFEIRKDKIKDLLTLGPYELRMVGDFGPKGLFYEEINSVEHGLSLILRGLQGQKQIHEGNNSFAKFHTLVYVDILAKKVAEDKPKGEWRSRITFAKIASMPLRERITPQNCCEDPPPLEPEVTKPEIAVKCCRGPSGPLAESISIRKDLSFLEQMFIKSNELRKIHSYYYKLQSMGMYMLMKPPKLAPSQYFRQSKLAHCLKDIVSGQTSVRLLLHLRPEMIFVQNTLEAMRFATRARSVPASSGKAESTVDYKVSKMCAEIAGEGGGGGGGDRSTDKMKDVLQQATRYFEDKLDTLEGTCKEQVKTLFETYREMLTHLFDLEKKEEEGGGGGGKELLDSNEQDEIEDAGALLTDTESVDKSLSSSIHHHKGSPSKSKPGTSQRKSIKNKPHNNNPRSTMKVNREQSIIILKEFPEDTEFGGEEEESLQEVKPLPPREQFWHDFSKGGKTGSVFTAFEEKQAQLRKSLLEHNEAQSHLTEVLSRLTLLELSLDMLEQERKFKRFLSDRIVPAVSIQEQNVIKEIQEVKGEQDVGLQKLKEIRDMIQEQKKELKSCKREVEAGFQDFLVENKIEPLELGPLPLSTLDHALASTVQESLGFPRIEPSADSLLGEESEIMKEIKMAKEFENLKRIAKEQVRILIKAYPKRPPWDDFY